MTCSHIASQSFWSDGLMQWRGTSFVQQKNAVLCSDRGIQNRSPAIGSANSLPNWCSSSTSSNIDYNTIRVRCIMISSGKYIPPTHLTHTYSVYNMIMHKILIYLNMLKHFIQNMSELLLHKGNFDTLIVVFKNKNVNI